MAQIPTDWFAKWTMDKKTSTEYVEETGVYDAAINAAVTQGDGLFRKALKSVGINDYIYSDFSVNTKVLSAVSISFWYKRDSSIATNAAPSLHLNTADTQNVLNLYMPWTSNNWIFDFKNTAAGQMSGAFDPAWDDEWVHFVATYDGTTMSFYANNVLVLSKGYIGATITLDNFWLMGRQPALLEQVYMYDYAVSADERTALFEEKPIVMPVDYLSRYDMEDISGAILRDTNGVNNGTVFNGTQATGVDGQALDISLTTEYAEANIPDIPVGTFSCWATVNTIGSTFPDNNKPFLSTSDVAGVGFMIYAGSGGTPDTFKVLFSKRDTGGTLTYISGTAPVFDVGTAWVHAAVSFDGADVRLYVNGVEALYYTLSQVFAPISVLTVGKEGYHNNYGHDGKIDDLQIFTRVLTASEIEAVYIEGSVKVGLAAHYTMDNISDPTLVDETGNTDGTITGATQSPGYIGKALLFDSTLSNKVDIGTALPEDSTFSTSMWVHIDNIPVTTQVLLSQNKNIVSASKYRGVFVTTGGELKFISRSIAGATNVQIGSGALTFPNWYHIVIVQDNLDCSMYINGVSAGSATLADTDNWLGVQNIACRNGAGGDDLFFDGKVDQVRTYNRPIDQLTIDALYFEEILTKILAGTITETLGIVDWHVRGYRIDNGNLTASVSTSDGTFELVVDINDNVPHLITCMPEQGVPWVIEEALIINQLRYPTNPTTTPYYYKVTIAGTTGVSEPTWPTVPGQTVVNGTVTFECVERVVQPITHSMLIPQ